jgi:hypothetical protein
MHGRGAAMEAEVKIYARNLANKSSPRKPVYSNEWRISGTNLVHPTSAICGVKNRTLDAEAYRKL